MFYKFLLVFPAAISSSVIFSKLNLHLFECCLIHASDCRSLFPFSFYEYPKELDNNEAAKTPLYNVNQGHIISFCFLLVTGSFCLGYNYKYCLTCVSALSLWRRVHNIFAMTTLLLLMNNFGSCSDICNSLEKATVQKPCLTLKCLWWQLKGWETSRRGYWINLRFWKSCWRPSEGFVRKLQSSERPSLVKMSLPVEGVGTSWSLRPLLTQAMPFPESHSTHKGYILYIKSSNHRMV